MDIQKGICFFFFKRVFKFTGNHSMVIEIMPPIQDCILTPPYIPHKKEDRGDCQTHII